MTAPRTPLFTSDLHFGHANIIKFQPYSRGQWASVEEMDEALIRQYNKRVTPEDHVYNLGDFTFAHKYERLVEIISRLNGTMSFISGNHDKIVHENEARLRADGLLGDNCKIIEKKDYAEISVNGQKICLMHFPLAVWNRGHHGSWNLYGHCHGSFKAVGKQLDVGFDSLDFGSIPAEQRGPWTFEQIKSVLDSRAIVVQDHHDAERKVD